MQPMALWKRILILVICAWGIVAAVPNLFYARVESHNDAIAAIARHLGENREWVRNVMHDAVRHHHVECRSREWHVLGIAALQTDAVRQLQAFQVRLPDAEHVLSQVDRGDAGGWPALA